MLLPLCAALTEVAQVFGWQVCCAEGPMSDTLAGMTGRLGSAGAVDQSTHAGLSGMRPQVVALLTWLTALKESFLRTRIEPAYFLKARLNR